MNNYTDNEPYNPHGFKEQIKIIFAATKATALDRTAYYALTADQQLVWELRADALNQALLFLMNSRN